MSLPNRLPTYKEKLLELLSSSDYCFKLSEDQLVKPTGLGGLLDWLTVNTNQENCLTPEEHEEFIMLQGCNLTLTEEEVDNALESYQGQSENTLLPLSCGSKEDELSECKYQLEARKQLLTLLETSNKAHREDLVNLEKESARVNIDQTTLLGTLLAANKDYNNRLNEAKQKLNNMRENLSQLDQSNNICADEGIDTFLSDRFDSTSSSNLSFQSLSSKLSTKGSTMGFLCQQSFLKYEKEKSRFCLNLKNILEKQLPKIVTHSTVNGIEPDLEMQIIMDILGQQKLSLVTNQLQLEATRATRNKIRKMTNEMEYHTSSSVISKFKLTDSDGDSSFMQDSFIQDDEVLNVLCRKWAELQTLEPTSDILKERTERLTYLIGKLTELSHIMKSKLFYENYIIHMLKEDQNRVEEAVKIYTKLHEEMKLAFDQGKMRIEIMKENYEDFLQHCSQPLETWHPLINCLAAYLNCSNSDVVSVEQHFTESSTKMHKLLVEKITSRFQTLVNVDRQMNDFFLKEMQPQSDQRDSAISELCKDAQMILVEMSNEIQQSMENVHSLQVQ